MNTDFLNPKFIRYFLSVADKGKFLSASKDLNISQPSLTRAIQILETNFKKKLFLRSKKGVKLTKEGEIFYLNAKAILSFNHRVLTIINENEIEEKKTSKEFISFGFARYLTSTHKENLLYLVKKNFKNKKIKIIEAGSNTLNKMIYENKLDFAISTIPEFKEGIQKTFLYNDPFCVVFYKGHHFQEMKEISLEEIKAEPNYIFRNGCEFFYYNYKLNKKGIIDFKIIDEIIVNRKKKGKHRDVIYTNSNSTAAHCIKAGLGVAIMPESVAVDQKLFFRLISKPSLSREIYLINRNENTFSDKLDNKILKSALWL
ncbi:MAG: LysR family transcriptional regulator [Alphaproteobacteria bacterium]|nr:LysR family transcriptional regulator [Alphaproteobacteria bacterium]